MLKIFFKKFGYIIALFVIVVVAAINMNVSTNKYGFSDRQLANVEALAKIEYNGNSCCYWESYLDWDCQSNEVEAEFMGVVHWECNTPFAWETCQDVGRCNY